MELTSNRPSPPSTIRTITIRDERRLFDKRVVVLRAIFLVKKKKRRGKDRRWRVHDGRAEQRSGRGMGWSRSSSLDRFSILPPGHRKYCLFGEIATIPLFTEWCYRIWARHISVQTCVHIERERETSGKDTRQAENRIDARYFYDRDSVKRSAGTIFHGFRGTWLIYLTSSFPLLSLSHKEVHSYLEKTRL